MSGDLERDWQTWKPPVGAAADAPPFPLVHVDPAEIAAEVEEWWLAGEAERSADRLRYGDVDSTATETGRTDL